MNAETPIIADDDERDPEYERWCANARRASSLMLRRLKRVFGADLGRLSGGGNVEA